MRVTLAILAAAAATAATAASAQGTVSISYAGLNTVEAGSQIITNYDDINKTPSGGLLETTAVGIPNVAAPVGSGNFAYVTARSTLSYTLDAAARVFSLDAGTLDNYNYINFDFADGTSKAYENFFGLTNGASSRVIFTANGAKITGLTLGSGENSFEFDNLAVGGVPEPATWALMILGFGGVGGMMRRRSAVKLATSIA